MCMGVWPACMYVSTCMYVYHMYAWCLQRAEVSIGTPGSVIKERCEPLCEYGEANLGPSLEKPVAGIAESSL